MGQVAILPWCNDFVGASTSFWFNLRDLCPDNALYCPDWTRQDLAYGGWLQKVDGQSDLCILVFHNLDAYFLDLPQIQLHL